MSKLIFDSQTNSTQSETDVSTSISSRIAKNIIGLFQYKYHMYITGDFTRNEIERVISYTKKIYRCYYKTTLNLNEKELEKIIKKTIIMLSNIHKNDNYYFNSFTYEGEIIFRFLIKNRFNYKSIFELSDYEILKISKMNLNDHRLNYVNELISNNKDDTKFIIDNLDFCFNYCSSQATIDQIKELKIVVKEEEEEEEEEAEAKAKAKAEAREIEKAKKETEEIEAKEKAEAEEAIRVEIEAKAIAIIKEIACEMNKKIIHTYETSHSSYYRYDGFGNKHKVSHDFIIGREIRRMKYGSTSVI